MKKLAIIFSFLLALMLIIASANSIQSQISKQEVTGYAVVNVVQSNSTVADIQESALIQKSFAEEGTMTSSVKNTKAQVNSMAMVIQNSSPGIQLQDAQDAMNTSTATKGWSGTNFKTLTSDVMNLTAVNLTCRNHTLQSPAASSLQS